jgi:hypothetical protein
MLILLSRLASLAFMLATEDSFALLQKSMMARVRSTARLRDDAAEASSRGHGSGESTERMESPPLSDVGSHRGAGAGEDESSRTRSYFFGPSTVTVSHIRGMIDTGYFAEGMSHEPREETMLEPQPDEAVVFEEFFTTGLRMCDTPGVTVAATIL